MRDGGILAAKSFGISPKEPAVRERARRRSPQGSPRTPEAVRGSPGARTAWRDDLELVERIRGGDGDAFQDLVDRFGDRILRLVYGILGDWHLSEDVVQDILVLVYRKIGGFDGRSSLLTGSTG